MNIKNNRPKILTEFGNEHNKSLLIKVDQALFKYLVVAEDGTVDTQAFLKLLMLQSKAESLSGEINWMDMIFNTLQAVPVK